MRGGDRETEVDGCFTGKEGGVERERSAHICPGERDKERKLESYCENMRNIKDLKLNKGGQESGRVA